MQPRRAKTAHTPCTWALLCILAAHGACGKDSSSPKHEKPRTAKQRLIEIRALIDGEEWERADVAIIAAAKELEGLDASELTLRRGIVQKAQGWDEKSLESFESASLTSWRGPEERVRAQLIRAEADERLGKPDVAMHAYQDVLLAKPNHPRALKALERMFLDVGPASIHLRDIGGDDWGGWKVTAFELAVRSDGKLTVELVDRGKRLKTFTRAVAAKEPIKLIFGSRQRTGEDLLAALENWMDSSSDVAPLKAVLPSKRRVVEFTIQIDIGEGHSSIRESFRGQSRPFRHSSDGSISSYLPGGQFSRHKAGKFFEVRRWTWKVKGDNFVTRDGPGGTEVQVRAPSGTGRVWKPINEHASPIWVLRAKFVPET